MSRIIRRTNPDRFVGRGGAEWKCSVCGSRFTEAEDARACAERDFAEADAHERWVARQAKRVGRTS